jgi:hypothetical protein
MSNRTEEIQIVSALKKDMLKKFRNDSNKGHWRDVSITDLIKKMEVHFQGLEQKLLEMCLEAAKDECVSIASSAAKICDNIERKFINDKAISGMPSSSIENLVTKFFTNVYDKCEKGGKQAVCEKLKVTLATISTWRGGGTFPRMETLDEMWLMVMEKRNESQDEA